MKIKKRFNPFAWSKQTTIIALVSFYAIFVPTFIYFGLQPAAATDDTTRLTIPALSIVSSVEPVALNGRILDTPDYSVGAYSINDSKTFLFAHSTTAFKNLHDIQLEDEIIYDSNTYIATAITTIPVTDVDMGALLAPSPQRTLVLMTCAGQEHDGEYDSRLIVVAVPK